MNKEIRKYSSNMVVDLNDLLSTAQIILSVRKHYQENKDKTTSTNAAKRIKDDIEKIHEIEKNMIYACIQLELHLSTDKNGNNAVKKLYELKDSVKKLVGDMVVVSVLEEWDLKESSEELKVVEKNLSDFTESVRKYFE